MHAAGKYGIEKASRIADKYMAWSEFFATMIALITGRTVGCQRRGLRQSLMQQWGLADGGKKLLLQIKIFPNRLAF